MSTTRILYWCGAYNGLFAIVGNLLLQKWGISFATLAYFILQHIELMNDLKTIYKANTEEIALVQLDYFEDKWIGYTK